MYIIIIYYSDAFYIFPRKNAEQKGCLTGVLGSFDVFRLFKQLILYVDLSVFRKPLI